MALQQEDVEDSSHELEREASAEERHRPLCEVHGGVDALVLEVLPEIAQMQTTEALEDVQDLLSLDEFRQIECAQTRPRSL